MSAFDVRVICRSTFLAEWQRRNPLNRNPAPTEGRSIRDAWASESFVARASLEDLASMNFRVDCPRCGDRHFLVSLETAVEALFSGEGLHPDLAILIDNENGSLVSRLPRRDATKFPLRAVDGE